MNIPPKYPHTQIVSDPPTPFYLKLYTVLIMLRYGARAGLLLSKKKLSSGQQEFAERVSDAMVGGLSAGVTSLHTFRTQRDIKRIYSEAVGLESGKNHHQISWKDLRNSKNVLVKNTMRRFSRFTFMRYLTDAVFFISMNKKIPAGGLGIDTGMFAKGSTLGYDILRRPSFFETLQRQVAGKFGTSGLGSDVTPYEMKELYNAYARVHNPSSQIHAGDVEVWSNNEALFKRIAYLINHSYRERRVPFESPDPRVPGRLVIQKQEGMRLPLLIYMMGNGFIDLEKIDQTRTFVEVANAHGVKALNDARTAIENGASLKEIHEKYDVVLPTYVIMEGGSPAVEEVARALDMHHMNPAGRQWNNSTGNHLAASQPQRTTHTRPAQQSPKTPIDHVQTTAAVPPLLGV